ncbi:MAG: dTDP-4-dehydrorhamnose reductase [Coprobacillaceae bacterium]
MTFLSQKGDVEMKVLVTGVNGQLGHDVVIECEKVGINAIGVDVEEMDITNKEAVEKVITSFDVDAVIHCAAYTAVDAAEDNVEACTKVNVDGTKNIAEVCKALDIKMMYFSTDYVFEGTGDNFWKETDECNPRSVYGRTKYEGEQVVSSLVDKHFIVRISWVFGVNGNNFVKTMLRLGKERGAVSVVNDQIGSPTYTYDLSKLIVKMIQTEEYGIYHASNDGICSWYDFACEIFKQAGMDVEVTPVDSSTFPAKAKRPANSRLSKEALNKHGFQQLRPWQEALTRYLKEIL